jgi:hypothetical protein
LSIATTPSNATHNEIVPARSNSGQGRRRVKTAFLQHLSVAKRRIRAAGARQKDVASPPGRQRESRGNHPVGRVITSSLSNFFLNFLGIHSPTNHRPIELSLHPPTFTLRLRTPPQSLSALHIYTARLLYMSPHIHLPLIQTKSFRAHVVKEFPNLNQISRLVDRSLPVLQFRRIFVSNHSRKRIVFPTIPGNVVSLGLLRLLLRFSFPPLLRSSSKF